MLAALSLGSIVGIGGIGCSAAGRSARGTVEPALVTFVTRALLVLAFILVIGLAVAAPTQSALDQVHAPAAAADSAPVAAPGRGRLDPRRSVAGRVRVRARDAPARPARRRRRRAAAFVALVAALPLLALLALAGALASFLCSWLLRSRRRGEMFTLVFVLALSLVSFLPMLLVARPGESREERRARAGHPFSIEAVRSRPAALDRSAAVRALRTRARRRHRRRSAHGVDGDPGCSSSRSACSDGAPRSAHGRLLDSVESTQSTFVAGAAAAAPAAGRFRAIPPSSRPWRSRRRGPRSDRCAAG